MDTLERPFPAYKGDEPYVFVCYAHDEAAVVYPEIEWLKEQGINLWYDEGIAPGEEWPQELADAIGGAGKVVFFLSSRSVTSRHCRDEIRYALNHHTPLLCRYLEDTALPGVLELSLGSSQAIMG